MAYGELKNGMRRIEKDKVMLKSPHPSPHVSSSLSDPSSSTIHVPHYTPTIRILGSNSSSSLILPRPVLTCPVLVFIQSCSVRVISHPVSVLSYPVLSRPVLSCPNPFPLTCPVLSCPVLSCPVLSCPVPILYPYPRCSDSPPSTHACRSYQAARATSMSATTHSSSTTPYSLWSVTMTMHSHSLPRTEDHLHFV